MLLAAAPAPSAPTPPTARAVPVDASGVPEVSPEELDAAVLAVPVAPSNKWRDNMDALGITPSTVSLYSGDM